MFEFSGYTKFIIVISFSVGAYFLGVRNERNSFQNKIKDQQIQQLIATNKQLELEKKSGLENINNLNIAQAQIESNFESIKNENSKLISDLNNCKLSYEQLRLIHAASINQRYVPDANSAKGSDETTTGKTAADLMIWGNRNAQYYFMCAAQYNSLVSYLKSIGIKEE